VLDDPTSPESAADIVRQYYAAIDAGDFRGAYDLWAGEGAASGKTFEEFAGGFPHTTQVNATIDEPGKVEGAAGSRYVEVPVSIRAVTDDGEPQRFVGHYVLRRSVVDGATEAERLWRIYSANLKSVR
jgi:ketosteroid isomerase-like protein